MTDARPALLISFAYYRRLSEDLLDEWERDGPIAVFADSGAFTAHHSGKPIELAEYREWVERFRHRFAVVASLDVIGDPAATERNAAAMADVGAVPVFHGGDPWGLLDRYVGEYPYVALGGMVGNRVSQRAIGGWMRRCHTVAHPHRTLLHAFGASSKNLRTYPFYSADSTTFLWIFKQGQLPLFDARTGEISYIKFRSKEEVTRNAALITANGIDLSRLCHPTFMRGVTPKARGDKKYLVRCAARTTAAYSLSLRARHRIDGPNGPGTTLYLASPTMYAPDAIAGWRDAIG